MVKFRNYAKVISSVDLNNLCSRFSVAILVTVTALGMTSCDARHYDDETLVALHERLVELESRLAVQEDIEAIRKLQYTYNYYNQSGYSKQLLSLVSENAESIEIGGRGVYLGKDGFRRAFASYAEDGEIRDRVKSFGDVLFQIASMDVINVAADRESATCRLIVLTPIFRGFPENPQQKMNAGVYEMKYVREEGQWLISKFKYVHVFSVGWGENGELVPGYSTAPNGEADGPTTWYHPWPESGALPFSYPNPVTGEYPPDNTNPTRYWIGNWSEEEFGKTGIRPDTEWRNE